MDVATLNYFVGLGTIALQVVTLVLFLAFLLRRHYTFFQDVVRPLEEWGLWIALIASLVASAMSLYYSNVIGYPPCDLCWWQRVCMYPQVVLFAVALWTKEKTAAIYASLVLSIVGLLIGTYNHVLQVSPAGTLPCPSQGVSCAQIFYIEFGYVTFPMLAITFFAFLIVLMVFVRRR